ncbi:hypothetical protein AKO1_004960 [Acrasis kona]|uniref:DUF202 domain-containing protein n=1 Tax=Acrasis kona TaxID=1008807 RepID=A0AAW2YQN2_9EUKA
MHQPSPYKVGNLKNGFTLIPKWTYVDNTGADGRDLQAIERTNLAWVRTAAAFLTIGFSAAKFIKSKHTANQDILTAIGVSVMFMGLIFFNYSFIRTMVTIRTIRTGYTSVDYTVPFIIVGFGVMVSVLCIVLLFL